jgi:hypothetical protein
MTYSGCCTDFSTGGWDKSSTVGKHASSTMTQTVAIEGLADAYMAFNTNYHDTGLFGVYGVTDRDRCEDFAWTVSTQGKQLNSTADQHCSAPCSSSEADDGSFLVAVTDHERDDQAVLRGQRGRGRSCQEPAQVLTHVLPGLNTP